MWRRPARYLLDFRWGGNSLAALYVSVLSGLVVAWQYDSAEPYYSSATIELVTPYGSFWRSCHFYSSQIFFVLLLAHFLAVAIRLRLAAGGETDREVNAPAIGPGEGWGRLFLTLPVSLLLLFTGYVLRGDATGEAAGTIGENIVLALPLAGEWLNRVLFNVSGAGMRVVYANHLVGLVLAGGGLAWHHLRRHRIRLGEYGWLLFLALMPALLVSAPFETFRLGEFHITGPWFFVSVQELLRHLQPVWGGIVFPMLGLAWGYLALVRPGEGRHLAWFLLWTGCCAVLTIMGWS